MRYTILSMLTAAVVVLAGCAAPQPLMHQTQSGQAEAMFGGRTLEQVRDVLAAQCMTAGMQIQTPGPNEVLCSKALEGGQGMAAHMLIGNSYATPPQAVLRFNLAPQGDGVRVVVYPWLETQMAFGQVRRVPLTSNSDRNGLQRMLWAAGGV